MNLRVKFNFLGVLFTGLSFNVSAQGVPWENPLKYAWSSDGISFSTPLIFQDSSGVPSLVRWKGDTLMCAFQWFRMPFGSSTWDRVAVKFSYDNGLSWNQPQPIVVNGLPGTYQRPFDPALFVVNRDSIRIYFSSSDGLPIGLDSTVNTYSAISTDGINFQFEPGPRVDEPLNRVIDPTVIRFNSAIHYAAPVGSPQQGAYHYISVNGISFNKVQDIPSDANHNWTGNYMLNDSAELRFYGAGMGGIWFNSSPNGGVWNGYVNTNVPGGDPSVIRTGSSSYFMVFVGMPYGTGILDAAPNSEFKIFPNPTSGMITVFRDGLAPAEILKVFDVTGRILASIQLAAAEQCIDLGSLPRGIYFLKCTGRIQRLVVSAR